MSNFEVIMISGCAQERACAREGGNYAHANKKEELTIIGNSLTHAHKRFRKFIKVPLLGNEK
jgi:hypothetical protein